jgi:class 3 adenylate cyclase
VAVPGARFCHNCGAALPAAATLPAAERRIVRVLFGDLSDFTSWSEDLDPERVGAVTDRVLAALAGAVQTFGGHVDKLTGDGIMAVFGAPVAHEDDAERAVRAALSMQRAVRRVLDDERGGGAPVGLRVGLNTGEVVAGIQASIEYTVIGDTVNTAARMEGLTKGSGHSLFIAESTHFMLLGDPPPLQYVGEFEIRGRAARMKIWAPGLPEDPGDRSIDVAPTEGVRTNGRETSRGNRAVRAPVEGPTSGGRTPG